MGMVSFYFCDAAREAGAVIATRVPIAQIMPGEGLLLEGGEQIVAPGGGVECRPAADIIIIPRQIISSSS